MKQQIGRVVQVFIPNEDKLVDVMVAKEIGFKVKLEDEEITIIEEINDLNAMIHKDDLVLVTTNNISGKEFIDEINFESAAELSESLSGRDITFICDDFKRVLSKIKAKIIQQQDLNCVLYELIEERQNTKIKSE